MYTCTPLGHQLTVYSLSLSLQAIEEIDVKHTSIEETDKSLPDS